MIVNGYVVSLVWRGLDRATQRFARGVSGGDIAPSKVAPWMAFWEDRIDRAFVYCPEAYYGLPRGVGTASPSPMLCPAPGLGESGHCGSPRRRMGEVWPLLKLWVDHSIHSSPSHRPPGFAPPSQAGIGPLSKQGGIHQFFPSTPPQNTHGPGCSSRNERRHHHGVGSVCRGWYVIDVGPPIFLKNKNTRAFCTKTWLSRRRSGAPSARPAHTHVHPRPCTRRPAPRRVRTHPLFSQQRPAHRH